MTEDGSVAHYRGSWVRDGKWEVWEYTGEMTVVGAGRGRSAVVITLRDEQGRLHPMFLTDLMDLIPFLVEGKYRGTWTGTKRGQNFGVRAKVPRA